MTVKKAREEQFFKASNSEVSPANVKMSGAEANKLL
eukprot:CAMPEP_0195269520 /NCGR_PEP_ID=MMETSP0706-20130129/13815_1 /TAXON_ID=33640 /ORGANISM="Asterionellopsis glacialis, Strain CCMP134" /LENGTH=35 /DNA_ID= /DNA_START= /DNA_END= /DNA_ORIENTATION=